MLCLVRSFRLGMAQERNTGSTTSRSSEGPDADEKGQEPAEAGPCGSPPARTAAIRFAAGDYLLTGFESRSPGTGSTRKGSLHLREISGQNSRSTSKPMSLRTL